MLSAESWQLCDRYILPIYSILAPFWTWRFRHQVRKSIYTLGYKIDLPNRSTRYALEPWKPAGERGDDPAAPEPGDDVPAKAGRNGTRIHAVAEMRNCASSNNIVIAIATAVLFAPLRVDACPVHPPGQLPGEEDVGQPGLVVGLAGAVRLLVVVRVVPADGALLEPRARHVDDAAVRRAPA